MANKFRLTLTIVFSIVIFLLFSGLLPSNQRSLNAHEQLSEQDTNIAQDSDSQSDQIPECKQDYINIDTLLFFGYRVETDEEGNYKCCPYIDGEPICPDPEED